MKKFALGVLAVCMVVLLVISLNGGFDDAGNENIKFSEAAFSMPGDFSASTEITSFLVGDFTGDDGSFISTDGQGGMKLIEAQGLARSGSCSLLQQGDGSTVLRFRFDGGEELYIFKLVSEDGDFILVDAEDNTVKYSPVII